MEKQSIQKSVVSLGLIPLVAAATLVVGHAENKMMGKQKEGQKTGMKKSGEDAAVTQRKKLMRGIGADMKRLKFASKQGSGWVVEEQVRQAAADMYQRASRIKKAFSKNTLAGKTTSTTNIWKNKKEFDLLADELAANAAALAQVQYKSGPAAIRKAVGLIGRQCVKCHKAFRKKHRHSSKIDRKSG